MTIEKEVLQTHGTCFVKAINALVDRAFGKGFCGDGNFDCNIVGRYPLVTELPNSRNNTSLGYIVRNFNYLIGSHSIFAGRFTYQDGSELTVIEGFQNSARSYAEMYYELTEKEPTVQTLDAPSFWEEAAGR